MRLINVNKYFNKGKSNELHVLNNISLDFPESGFVAIMGQSGSGKTTLLNALCGLDKINSGEIEVNETTVKKYSSSVWDRLRNQEFGYIFQNYNIFEERTVFENVALSLEFLGMRDLDEIKTRVMQALEMVGMDKYRNRPAGALSGGEMQRVAIARALVKNPKIVIADEPTGNLDEKNTLLIMNILKKISKDRLVILVTHEKEIGEFYADTIVNIRDGQIQDVRSGSNDELKLYSDNTIYLQDLNSKELKNDQITITQYYSDKFEANVKVDLILEGNNIIIKASSDKNIKFATTDSNISIVDGKKPQLTKDEIDKNLSNVNEIIPLDKSKLSCKYNIGFFKHIKKGFQRVFDLSNFKKLFLVGFVISACLMVLSFSAYFGINYVDEKDFLTYDRDLIEIEYKDNTNVQEKYNTLKTFVESGKINYIYPQTDISRYNNYDHIYGVDDLVETDRFTYPIVEYFTFDNLPSYINGASIEATYIPYTNVNNYRYVRPEKGEIVIDRFVAERIYSTSISQGNTIKNDELLKLSNVLIGDRKYKVVGVCEENNGVVYTNPADQWDFMMNGISTYNNQIASIDKASVTDGKVVIIYSVELEEFKVGKKVTIAGKEFEVVGFEVRETDNGIYLNTNDIEYVINCNSIAKSKTILVSSNLKVRDLKKLFDKSIYRNIDKKYDVDRKELKSEKFMVARILLIFAVVTIIAPLIFLFFLMRSNLIARVKEVGIYRALGLSKGSVIKMHAAEAIAISATGTLAGWIIGLVLIYRIRSVSIGQEIFTSNPLVTVGCLIMCVLINLIVGCIPIVNLLQKTPQQILSKYDM